MFSPSEAQLILQVARKGGGFHCFGFSDLPIPNPVLIVLVASGSAQGHADLSRLYNAIHDELKRVVGSQAVDVPCVEKSSSPLECAAGSAPDCQKLLVLVGDNQHPFPITGLLRDWPHDDPTFSVLPVFPISARSGVSRLLPGSKEYTDVNAKFWSSSPAEVVPAIFAITGISAESARIFISYRQKDASALAIQLFDALSHEGFDVFLDHFRIPPGVNFQARLTQELGDKSMVLLLESEHVLDSQWTTYEINVAKTCGLGIFALHLPGGPIVAGVDDRVRKELSASDFDGESFSSGATLKTGALAGVVQTVKSEHDRALIRRRQILRDSFVGALRAAGGCAEYVEATGALRVQSGDQDYLVWLTPRPADLADFHHVHGTALPPRKGVIIGLSRLMEPTRMRRSNWLAGLCQLALIDEGHLKLAATEIARGKL